VSSIFPCRYHIPECLCCKSFLYKEKVFQSMIDFKATNTLLLLQHPPTYTVGRRFKDETGMKDQINKLSKLGSEFHFSKRVRLSVICFDCNVGWSNHISWTRTAGWIPHFSFKRFWFGCERVC
jgi:hypothetical protein